MIRATALDSTALDGLSPANPELTTVVLAESFARPATDVSAEPVDLVAECHRRALVIASEVAADGRAVEVNLMAVLQDMITEAQASYTVTTETGEMAEVGLPRRQYKPVSNYMPLPGGGLAVFAPAGQVAAEMARLATELASAEFAALHPAIRAAYAHYALTAIHPFADGNGRLARTVASIFLIRAVRVPLLVFADQWPWYYQAVGYQASGVALKPAERQALTDFVASAALGAMDLAANLITADTRGGRTGPRTRHRQPDRAAHDDGARGLIAALSIELRELLVSPARGVRIALTQTRAAPEGHSEGAYRVVTDPQTGRVGVRVAIRVDGRPELAADLEFVALASNVPGDLLPIALRETRHNELFEAALQDVYPLVTEPTALRVRLWARRLLSEASPAAVLVPVLPGPVATAPGDGRVDDVLEPRP